MKLKCWRNICENDWLKFEDLIERKDESHYDYVCPKCESVIICSNKKIIKIKMEENNNKDLK